MNGVHVDLEKLHPIDGQTDGDWAAVAARVVLQDLSTRPELGRWLEWMRADADAARELVVHFAGLIGDTHSLLDEVEGLRPCPFCGGEAEMVELNDEANKGGSVITCTRCQCSTAVHFDRKTNLVSSWNDRS